MNIHSDTKPETLGVIIGSSSVEMALSLLRSNKDAKDLVVTFDGDRTNNDNPLGNRRTEPLFSEAEIVRFFKCLPEILPYVERLRLEWDIINAHFYEQSPLIPIRCLEYLFSASNIRSLALYRVKLSGNERDFSMLAESAILNRKLRTIRIEFCTAVGSPNLNQFVHVLSKLQCLEEFELIGFQGDPQRGCTSSGLLALCQDTTCLSSFKIWGGILQSEEKDAIAQMSIGLKTNPNIRDLEIGLFNLDIDSSLALATVFRQNKSLKRVWLDVDSGLDEERIAPLSNVLKNNLHIRSFNIVSTSDDVVQEPVLKLFADMTEVNTALMHLTVRGCNEHNQSSKYRREIDLYLKLNRVGRQKLLGEATSRLSTQLWLSALICENENVSVTYYLLKRNPCFISQFVQAPTKIGKRKRAVGLPEQRRKMRRLI